MGSLILAKDYFQSNANDKIVHSGKLAKSSAQKCH
jgi:hypothetical protein